MPRRISGFALSFLAVLSLGHRPAAGGEVSTPLQTESIPMTPTDWGPGTGGIANPLAFQQFNPKLGTLTAIDLTLQMTVRNNFELIFPSSPTPTTLYVATTATMNPSVLANPSQVQLLTDGPTVTVTAPNGVTQLFGGPATTVPVDVVSLTESGGTWSSTLPVTDPHYIPPSNVQLSLARTLDASNAASLLPEFIGTGLADLPITAVAHSSFYSSSGNGGGMVLTSAGATVTLQYWYIPSAASLPEPSSLILLGLGAGITFLAVGRRRCPAGPARRDRT
jgi:hypothetical protein